MLEQIGPVTLYQGDCLDVLRQMPDCSVDAVVTDPPYCSGARTAASVTNRGGMSRGARWNTKPLDSDQMTATGYVWLIRAVAREALRLLVPGGWFVCFVDWRQYPTLYGAIETTNLRVNNMLVWDKRSFALGNGFRNQHELAIVASKGTPTVYDRSTGNVLSVRRLSQSTAHPTEKPVDLFAPILRVVSAGGGLVLDPFLGSGTTAVTCIQEGRRCIGIERDPEYYAIARQRIAATPLPPLAPVAPTTP
jgi:site-specific DNA-methyltransferase (adenine-specific)